MNNNKATPEVTPEANEDSYINKITLEYLLNPSIHIKTVNSNDLLEKDISFYKKRICQITKDMSRGEFINNNLKSIFHNYASQLIYYFKQVDYDDQYHKEYNNDSTIEDDKDEQTHKQAIQMIKDININDPMIRNKEIKKN
jgi:hypothetical protein